jgi:hypothetical protein
MSERVFEKVSLAELVEKHLPARVDLGDSRKAIPRLAKDVAAVESVREAVREVQTVHRLYLRDARCMDELPDESVHLILTSPPYWTLKEYPEREGQLGRVSSYDSFLDEMDTVWRALGHCRGRCVPLSAKARTTRRNAAPRFVPGEVSTDRV